jgi:PAS domain S-box-containing protein/putative nucleotidyltransferase with HDIG domain
VSAEALQILLVDDNEDHVELIRRAFAADGKAYHFSAARSLAEARKLLKEITPALMIVDYRLPDGDGLELLPGDAGKRVLPIIILTGHGDERVAAAALKSGAMDYIVKSDETLADMPHIADRALREWGYVTECRCGEEELRNKFIEVELIKQQWQQTFDAVTDPIFLHDEDGCIIRANKAYAAKADMPVERIIGHAYWKIFPKSGARLRSCESAEHNGEASEEISMADGQVFLVHSYVMDAVGEEGVRFIHWMEDITERKRAEQITRDIDERFRSVTEAAQDAIIMLDNDGKISLWNRAAEYMLGYSQNEAMGRELHQMVIPQAFRKQHQQGFAAFRQSGQGSFIGNTVELTALHKSGREFPIELSLSATMISGKWHAVGLMRDISKRRQIETALKQSHERLQCSLDGTIAAIASAVEARDPYTAGHQQRVAELAHAIARKMKLDEDMIEGIHRGAIIHDIGKIHLPAEILSKPSRLSEIEYILIKGHPQVGYDILKDIDFPWPIAEIAHQHHERINGSGYPLGLKGDEICLEAKIVAVADVVEAISSHRPYRPALGIKAALEEIEAGRGRRFDPAAVDACMKLFTEHSFSFE